MPGQRHEPHYKICNLRYGTPGYRMNYCYKLEVSPARQTVKETIGVGVNEKAALSSDKNCPFVYINFDFTLVNKVASL